MADLDRLLETMIRTLPLHDPGLGREYRYQHLTLALIDAVFSIGIRYPVTEHVVWAYAEWQGLTPYRDDEAQWPPIRTQEPLDALLALARSVGVERLAADVFRNRNRTSSTNGILKAEAVVAACRVLVAHGVHHFQDLEAVAGQPDVRRAFLAIPGQHSGVSWDYFWMLAGDECLIKTDRHIVHYVEAAVGHRVGPDDAAALVVDAAHWLAMRYPGITPRRLDYLIWNQERGGASMRRVNPPLAPGVARPASSPARRLGAKDWIRAEVARTGGVRLDDGVAAGYTLITLKTALSDLKNPKYCGAGGVLVLEPGTDGRYRPRTGS
jgi:hypothetical protein